MIVSIYGRMVTSVAHRTAKRLPTLLEARTRSGLSQRGLARKAKTYQETISRWERNGRWPTYHHLRVRLLLALNLDPSL